MINTDIFYRVYDTYYCSGDLQGVPTRERQVRSVLQSLPAPAHGEMCQYRGKQEQQLKKIAIISLEICCFLCPRYSQRNSFLVYLI